MAARNSQHRLDVSYGAIADSLLACAADPRPQRWLVTGVNPGDGSTAVAIELARALAGREHEVALVDADLRGCGASQRAGDTESPGLSDAVAEAWPAERVCQPDHPLGSFTMVTAGTNRHNPLELLRRPRMADLLAEFSERFDIVIVDTPCMGKNKDALVLAPHVDGCVLVVREGKTQSRDGVRAKQQIAEVGGTLIGAVVNQHREWIPRWVRRWL